MKKILSIFLAVISIIGAFSINAFAQQRLVVQPELELNDALIRNTGNEED